MFYTRKGDDGTTRTIASKSGTRISKSSCQTEALGTLDELNSFLGLVKVKISGLEWNVGDKKSREIILWIQNCLFIIQAEIAGADKKIGKEKINWLEKMIDIIEKELPPIKTFSIPGSTEESSLFDIVRTLARKTERKVIGGIESGEFKVSENTLAFLNRLSSLLYAMARLSAHKSGITEESPNYE
jgi:cob(I)alamin adenosyltransferase